MRPWAGDMRLCNDPDVSTRALAVLILCLAFVGTRVAGLHFHVADAPDHHEAVAAHHGGHHGHDVSHLTSDFAADHLAGHVSHDGSDVGAAKGLIAKLPALGLPLLIVIYWLGFALISRLFGGLRIPVQWMRPPDIRLWPVLQLPPSRGPPRAI